MNMNMNELIKTLDIRGYPPNDDEALAEAITENSSEIIIPANVVTASENITTENITTESITPENITTESITPESITPVPANVVVLKDLPHTTIKSKLMPVVCKPPTILLSTIVRSPQISTYEVIIPTDFQHGTELLVSCEDNTFYLDTDEHTPTPGDRFEFNIIPDPFKKIIRDIVNDHNAEVFKLTEYCDQLVADRLAHDNQIAELTEKLESYRLTNLTMFNRCAENQFGHPETSLSYCSVGRSNDSGLLTND